MPVPQPKTVTIYGREITPKVGDYMILDGKLIGELLQQGDEPVEGTWAGCQFRWPMMGNLKDTHSINVEITGRTLQRRPLQEGLWVSVEVTWVNDGEPNTTSKGWLNVK
jgi:hypothetical protein